MKTVSALSVVLFVFGCSSPSNENSSSTSAADTTSAASSGARIRFQHVAGGWTNSTPCNTTFYDPNTGHLKCDGYTNWTAAATGGFSGTSHYYFNGFVDLNTGDIAGALSETFTGSGLGTSGTFHMTEAMTISASTGAINIESLVDGGTGGYMNLGGILTFTGTSDTSGIGTGSYKGAVGTVQ